MSGDLEGLRRDGGDPQPPDRRSPNRGKQPAMNRVPRRLFVSVFVLGLVGLASEGCKTKSDDIPVGAYLSLSGSESTFGTDTRDGIELALQEVNGAGGVKGKKIRVV